MKVSVQHWVFDDKHIMELAPFLEGASIGDEVDFDLSKLPALVKVADVMFREYVDHTPCREAGLKARTCRKGSVACNPKVTTFMRIDTKGKRFTQR